MPADGKPRTGERVRRHADAMEGTTNPEATAPAATAVADAGRLFDGWLLDRLRRAVAHRELVVWEDDGFRKPRLVVTFPEDATGDGPLDAFEQALVATPADATALGFVDAMEPAAPTVSRPTREAPAFLPLDGGWAWRALDTPDACARAARESGNAVEAMSGRDALPDGSLRDGRAYYGLSGPGTDGVAVVVVVGGRGRFGAPDGPFALGPDGSDPYPLHSARIGALSDRLDFPLPHECHPSYGTAPDMRAAFHPARLPSHVMAQARAAARSGSVPLEDLLGVLVAEALDAREARRRG